MENKNYFRCTCTCSIISIEKWDDDDGEVIITLYERTYKPNESIWVRVKRSFKMLIGRECLHGEVVLEKEDFEKFKEIVNKI